MYAKFARHFYSFTVNNLEDNKIRGEHVLVRTKWSYNAFVVDWRIKTWRVRAAHRATTDAWMAFNALGQKKLRKCDELEPKPFL